ncbi:LysR family transcriptional regulator [Massilia sp. G4R7]|uniref:LysR family transcriptional regulator n=2 Tax=Massilia TaxID=149698 RepID=A0ABS8Q005_9BURK|nr:LysR family transcriptional regulator [Massilia phyllostachyos]MCD2515063.1 LysR family transcriptional regulator [Massilia phyllostachyos]
MTDLKLYAVFAETVAAGSMSAAARRLGMTPSAVSQAIRTLERETGVTLLHRSTRKLTLTDAGARCLPHCRRMLDAAGAAGDALAQARDAPVGELRIAAPVGFGAHIAPALAPVLAAWPQLRLQLLLDDAMIDLVDARIDIALRAGTLPDSDWVARPLGRFEIILCAAPVYIEAHGMPQTAEDLAAHHWLASPREHDSGARIVCNNQLTLQQLCEQGLGLARLAHADAAPALARGLLVRVLPGVPLPALPVTALTPGRSGDPAKTRVALDALRRHFAALPGCLSG